MKTDHVVEVAHATGRAGMALDLATLRHGRVPFISEDAVVLYKNMEAGKVSVRLTFYI